MMKLCHWIFGSGIISSISNSTGYVLIDEKQRANKGEKSDFTTISNLMGQSSFLALL